MANDLQLLLASEAIRNLNHRFFLYADTNQFHKMPDLFAEDCVFDERVLGFPLMSGKQAVRDFYEGQTPGALAFAAHYVTNQLLTELDESRGVGTLYVLFEGGLKDGTRVKLLAYFEDSYACVAGNWVFQTRKLIAFTEPEGFQRIPELKQP